MHMSTKKDDILRMIGEGKTVEEIISMGFTKKYINEVLRKTKNSNDVVKNSRKENSIPKKYDSNEVNDIVSLRKDIAEIKRLLKAENNLFTQGFKIENKLEAKKRQLEETIKMLNVIYANEQLLQYLSLNINITISDINVHDISDKQEKSTSQQSQKNKGNDEKINPIEIYREKGDIVLKEILSNFDINTLKDIARQYTPDSRGYVYKWVDVSKIIDYIIERASNLSEKGSVFVTDSQTSE